MTSPLEKQFVALLDEFSIEYLRPEQDVTIPTNLDFYLPDFDLFVEIKCFHSDRISRQLSSVPHRSNALVIMGPQSITAFRRFIRAVGGMVDTADLKSAALSVPVQVRDRTSLSADGWPKATR